MDRNNSLPTLYNSLQFLTDIDSDALLNSISLDVCIWSNRAALEAI